MNIIFNIEFHHKLLLLLPVCLGKKILKWLQIGRPHDK